MRNGNVVYFEGKQIAINDLAEGFYLVKLKSYNLYTGPRIKKEEIINFINKRNWEGLDVEVSPADFPYAFLCESLPLKRKPEVK